jgi:hypothetical protein
MSQGTKQRNDVRLDLVGQAIDHALAVTLRADQSDPAQLLQVLRRIGQAEAHPLRQRLNATRSLGKLLDQFHPVLMSQCLGNLGKRRPNSPGGRPA